MKAIILCAAVAVVPLLSACNTFEGVGKDVQRGGEKIEDTATKAKGDKSDNR